MTVTVTSDRYCDMLQNFLRPKLHELEEDVWFQQDGATANTSHCSLSILREMFPGHLISLHGDIGWPARSPDLTTCDFFLWGYLKATVYARRPGTIEQLKEAIRQEVAAIPPAMTCKVMTTSVNGFKSVSSITAAT